MLSSEDATLMLGAFGGYVGIMLHMIDELQTYR